MELTGGKLIRNDMTRNAKGGTEMMAERLSKLPKKVLEPYQIIFSRVGELKEDKLRLLYLHDLPGDPGADAALKNNGWNKFHMLVFVSNWQMQAYINHYQIPYSKCLVMLNAVEPLEVHDKPKDIVRLAYWSTPHRGLNILLPVFDALAKKHDNIELDVYSSFDLYGWSDRDKEFESLFEFARTHPKVNYHGAIANKELRERLKQTHILAYPSTWPETSCLVLMESMSAGMLAVHSNFAALYETAGNWTQMYQYNEDPNQHASQLYFHLEHAIENFWTEPFQTRLKVQKTYSDVFYNWDIRANQWEAFLSSDILKESRSFPQDSGEYFTFRTI
jgi:UDP-glucose:(glucosyl)LPS alpha-1,2-glucosyltransferase